MNVQRLSHIGICVAELERSVRFYRDILGFEEVSRLQVAGEDAARLLQIDDVELHAVYLQREDTRIELLYYPTGHEIAPTPVPMNRTGFTHLSLRVSDLDNIITAIIEAGGNAMPTTHVENKKWGSKAAFVTDPDGLRIELLQLPGDPNALPGA